MVIVAWLGAALAGDCGRRLTLGPLMTPQWVPTLPYGGNVRYDHTFACPAVRGTSAALTVDLGAVPIWIHHTGYFPTLRQQLGVHIEPWARGAVRGGPYLSPRVAVTEIFWDEGFVIPILGLVLGYRWEWHHGLTVQLGAGAEVWMPTSYAVQPWPAAELRVGKAFVRPDGGRDGVRGAS